MPPGQVVQMLNEYFPTVIEPINRHNGVVNQFQGDAMLVTFNVPVEDTCHADRAVRAALEIQLERNAAAVIFAHNHPSGDTEPSNADQSITKRLKAALALIDVRVLDHVVVSATQTTSLKERGLI